MRVLRFGAVYCAAVFACGFVLGALRVTFVVPKVGVRIAELAETPLMIGVSMLIAFALVRRWRLDARQALAGGAIALAFLLGLELAMAWALNGLAPLEYVLTRDPVSGSAYAMALVIFMLAPAVAARRLR